MNKREFLRDLEDRLKGLPQEEIEERLNFYDEMIEDMIEEGMTEEEAVSSLGGMKKVVQNVAEDTKMTTLVKERIKPKRSVTKLEVLLLILGFPVWFPLLLTGIILFAILVFLAFVFLFVLIIVTYSMEIGFVVGSFSGFAACFESFQAGDFKVGYLAMALVSLGLALVFLSVCFYATKLTFKIAKKVLIGIKAKLIGGKQNA